MLNRVIGGMHWDWKHDLRISTPLPSFRRDPSDHSPDRGYVEFKRKELFFRVEGELRPAYFIVAEGTIVDAAVEIDGQWFKLSREIGKSSGQS